jgi:hypothetical protein
MSKYSPPSQQHLLTAPKTSIQEFSFTTNVPANKLLSIPSTKKEPTVRYSNEEQQIIAAIAAYTETKTRSLESATEALAKPLESIYLQSGCVDKTSLYTSLLRYSFTIPWDDTATHCRLCDIFEALKLRREPVQASVIELKDFPESTAPAPLWNSLKDFKIPASSSLQFSSNATQGMHQWRNMTSFLAHLTARNLHDFSNHAVWTLRDTLEKEEMEDTWVGDRLDEFLPNATIWILICGEVLYGKSVGRDGRERGVGDRRRLAGRAVVKMENVEDLFR